MRSVLNIFFKTFCFFLDALLADLQNSSKGSVKKPASNDDFPPPPGNLQNAYQESQISSKVLTPSAQIIQKPSLNSENEDSQKSFNNLSELEGLLQDLDKASDYHRKSIARFKTSSTNIAQAPLPPPEQIQDEGTLKHKCTICHA
jgi:hypothetical protein